MDYKLLFFVVMLIVASTVFGYALRHRLKNLLLGRPENRLDNLGRRVWGFISLVLGQRKVLKEKFGIIHLVIFWGFIVISLGTLQFVGEGLVKGLTLPLIGSSPSFYLVKDTFSVLVLCAVAVAAFRRFIIRPEKIEANLDAAIILILIAGLVATELISNGLNLFVEAGGVRGMTPVSNLVSGVAVSSGIGVGSARWLSNAFWWVHVTLLFGFLAYIPYSKHMHLLAAPFNVFFQNLRPRGSQIEAVDFDNEEAEEFGVSKVEDFTRKQLLDLYACAQCGRCQENCPAYLSGKPLSPKQLMNQLKEHLDKRKYAKLFSNKDSADETLGKELIGEVISQEEIWACTTCYSCQDQCPVTNEHINKIIDMRRSLVMDQGDFPQEAVATFRNIEKNYNPWGLGWNSRGDWLEDLGVKIAGTDQSEVEYLYWVGCAGSFDERSRKITQSMVKIMREAGISFAILGAEEKCCGDSVRRLGNEYLFQTLANENIARLNQLSFNTLITHCPHCFNTLKNEYPALGGSFEVIHHTKLLADLLKSHVFKLKENPEGLRVTYHDSCYLGRYNEEYQAPREILRALPGITLQEARRNRSRSFCCGAGGGRMWLEENLGVRINEMRVDELMEKMPQVISVNCPFCLTMIGDGLKVKKVEERVSTLDIAEIVERSIEYKSVVE